MSKAGLKVIKNSMSSLGLNYKFMEWKGEPMYPYFIGEYQETPPLNEDGMLETTFILTGFSRCSWDQLEEAKQHIENHFNKVGGKTVKTESGSVVAVFYSNSLVVPTGDAELKKIQINLIIKEWSVN